MKYNRVHQLETDYLSENVEVVRLVQIDQLKC